MIELVELIMQKEGMSVSGALSGQEGLALIRQSPPQVVLLDIMMPGMDGWDVFKEIKATPDLQDIPVIILTARDSTFEEIIARDRAGVDDYITKPFTPQELRRGVKKVLSRKK
ncbi:MAG TPA: response regulator [Chloroflexi bacterium]|nr:response regulator [Chloroflexota bacterium]